MSVDAEGVCKVQIGFHISHNLHQGTLLKMRLGTACCLVLVEPQVIAHINAVSDVKHLK